MTITPTSEDMITWQLVEDAIAEEARRLCRVGCDGSCVSCRAPFDRDFRHDAVMSLYHKLEMRRKLAVVEEP